MRQRLLVLVALALSCPSCGRANEGPPSAPAPASPRAGAPSAAKPAPAASVTPVPLYEGLGPHTRSITTRSPQAARYFDQGLNFYFGFNHAEAIRSFAYAAALDPSCAMAEWGVALANGPHMNDPTMDDEHVKAAMEALGRAQALRASASPVEAALIDALAARYREPQPKDRRPLDVAYATAMREVWRSYPKDADVGALFAESLVDVHHPSESWSPEGKPLFDVSEVITTLDAALVLDPKHPLANHLEIHALEPSPSPERADAAADLLRTLQPALGHMVHMPSHIDVRRGRWEAAVVSNEKAIFADRAYLAGGMSPSNYWYYIAHSHHMLMYAAMMRGQSDKSIAAARSMTALFSAEVIKAPKMAKVFDGMSTIPLEVLLRFGKWDEILAEAPRDGFPFFEAFRHYARGVALAAKGDVAGAKDEQRTFAETSKKVPSDYKYRRDDAAKVLGVAEKLLEGEVLFRDGRQDAGLEAMREAVRREDALHYSEPPEWVHPVRHALGASLLKAKRAAEAEAVYRDDLAKHPNNGWSLMGLARSLKAQKKTKQAAEIEAEFKKAWEAADTPLSSSCFCQPGE